MTLLHAFEATVETPVGSQLAVWRFLLTSDGVGIALHRHEILHADVARDAVRVLLDVDAGEGVHDLALAVLRGSNVAEITNDDLFTIADRAVDEARARRVSWLVERVHEERGLSPEFIVALRDRLAASAVPAVRAAAVEIGGLLARLDKEFVLKMLADESPEFEATDASFAGEMIMTWSFEPWSPGTRITVTVENVPPGISQTDHDAGLRSSLQNLARYLGG